MFVVRIKKEMIILFLGAICIISAILIASCNGVYSAEPDAVSKKGFIKYVEFNPTYDAMEKAMREDIRSHSEEIKINWIDILSFLAVKYGGDFKKYRESDIDAVVKRLKNGEQMSDISKDMKHYNYYHEAYTAVLGEFVGNYKIQRKDSSSADSKAWEDVYGLKAFSPIARTFPYCHYDDFGASRSYGYSRPHLGHDLMAATGTPVVAVESGIVEVMGWNQYGGWRIGIRSFDKRRYYYYAHLRQNRPYHADLCEGKAVKAGDVIGYVGRTGYSSKENVNNITESHLHIGMELIFDESQKESNNEIWIDMYEITKLLEKNKSSVIRNQETKEFFREFNFDEPSLKEYAE